MTYHQSSCFHCPLLRTLHVNTLARAVYCHQSKCHKVHILCWTPQKRSMYQLVIVVKCKTALIVCTHKNLSFTLCLIYIHTYTCTHIYIYIYIFRLNILWIYGSHETNKNWWYNHVKTKDLRAKYMKKVHFKQTYKYFILCSIIRNRKHCVYWKWGTK